MGGGGATRGLDAPRTSRSYAVLKAVRETKEIPAKTPMASEQRENKVTQ